MFEEIFQLLSHFDLDAPNSIDRISGITPRRLRIIYESLWREIYESQYNSALNAIEGQSFRFLAGPSIRGENCAGCRPGKLEFLARYATLYSDFVILPLPLYSPEDVYITDKARWNLQSTLGALFQLKAPIEAGVIRPAVMTTAECEHTLPKAQELVDIATLYADELADQEFEKFTMYYKPNSGSNLPPTLYVDGPTEYLEHGSIAIEYPEPPAWIAKSWRPDASGRILVPITKARRTGWVQHIFRQIAANTTFHMAYGALWQAKFLTDLRGETVLMGGLDDEGTRREMHSATLFRAMAHSLPFIDNLPIVELLRLRNEIRESFEQYRWAISSILRRHSGDQTLSKRAADEICMTELVPKIAALENRVAAEKERFKGKLLTTGGVMSLLVALGMNGTLTPPQVFGLLGGAASLRVADMLSEARSPTVETSTQDVYFLLRLKQAQRRKRNHLGR